MTLYQAVEGVSPFHRETPTGSLTAVILDEAPPPVRAGRLTPLITALLEKEPSARAGIAEARALARGAGGAADGAGHRCGRDDRGAAGQHAAPAGCSVRTRVGGDRFAGFGNRARSGIVPRLGYFPWPGHGTRRDRAARARRPWRPRRPWQSGWAGRHAPAAAERHRQPHVAGHGSAPSHPPGPGPDQRRTTGAAQRAPGTGQRPIPRPHTPGAPVRRRARLRPRAVILAVLVLATIGGVLVATMRPASFNVGSVKAGDFVKVDSTGHITGIVSAAKARSSADGRRVTAREDQADPDVCKKFHALGRADVETGSSISFCLVRPLEETGAAEPAQ